MKALVILATVLLLVVAVNNSRFMGRSTEVDNTANAIAPVAIPSEQAQSDEAAPGVKLVLLALWPEGFEKAEMQLDPGEYLFIVGNRTGRKAVNVRLEREGNERVAEAAVGGRQGNWKQRLKLTTGTYIVIADDNPGWICRITVGP